MTTLKSRLQMTRYLLKRVAILVIPFILLGVLLVSGETACDDSGTNPAGSGGFLDPCS